MRAIQEIHSCCIHAAPDQQFHAIGIYFEQLGRGPCAEKLLCHYTLFVQGERCWAEL